MNGTQDGGTKRTAGKAFGTGFPNLVMHGNGDDTHKWTTLCPAPNAVFPSASNSKRGAGCIIFDTYMNQDNSADEAVTQIVGTRVSARRWFAASSTDSYLVSFDFGSGGLVTLRANADKCRSFMSMVNGKGRKLDGNRQAPNGDKKEWSF
jgi:hypothetical protein